MEELSFIEKLFIDFIGEECFEKLMSDLTEALTKGKYGSEISVPFTLPIQEPKKLQVNLKSTICKKLDPKFGELAITVALRDDRSYRAMHGLPQGGNYSPLSGHIVIVLT